MPHTAHRGPFDPCAHETGVAASRPQPRRVRPGRIRPRRLAILAGAVALLTGPVHADPVEWALEQNGLWFTPANWTPNATVNNNNPPGTLYDVFIGQNLQNNTTFTVSLDAPATIQSLTVEKEQLLNPGDVFLDLTTNTLNLNTNLIVTDASIVGTLGGGSVLSVAGNVTLTRAMFMWTRLETAPGTIITFGGAPTSSTIICDTDVNHRGSCIIDGGEELIIMGDSGFNALAGSTIDLRDPAGLITGSPGGGGTPTLLIEGTILQNTPGASTTINGLDFQNTGTLDVSEGTLSTDGVILVGGLLDAGTWRISNGATLDLAGAAITTNAATVELDGAATTFAALDTLAANDAAGALRLTGGADFTTQAGFTNDGLLAVGDATEFTVDPGSALTNFTAGTLTGGEFDIAGTLRFDNADIADLDAAVTLDGPGAAIVDALGQDALRNLDTIAAAGDLTLRAGRELTTSGDLTVATTGRLGVEVGSTFSVPAGNTVTNFAGGTFTGGVFDIQGTLVIDAAVETLDGDFTLDGPVSNIIRPAGGDVFETLSLIDTNGALTLRNGRTLSVLGNVTVNGRLTVESGPPEAPSILVVPGDVTQTSGVAELRSGGIVRVGGGTGLYNLTGGLLTGAGRIEGNLIQTGGTVSPGNSPGRLDLDGNWLLNSAAAVDIELAGTAPGMADFIESGGQVVFGSGSSAGTLTIDLIGGYVPSPAGDTFEIIRASQRLGQFANVSGPMVGGNPAFTVFYTSTSVWVTVYAVPSPAGLMVLATAGLAAARRRRPR